MTCFLVNILSSAASDESCGTSPVPVGWNFALVGVTDRYRWQKPSLRLSTLPLTLIIIFGLLVLIAIGVAVASAARFQWRYPRFDCPIRVIHGENDRRPSKAFAHRLAAFATSHSGSGRPHITAILTASCKRSTTWRWRRSGLG